MRSSFLLLAVPHPRSLLARPRLRRFPLTFAVLSREGCPPEPWRSRARASAGRPAARSGRRRFPARDLRRILAAILRLEQCVERFEPCGPFSPLCGDPLRGATERGRIERENVLASGPSALNELGPLEHADVLRHRVQRHGHRPGESVTRALPRARRFRMARRVGSESATSVRSRLEEADMTFNR